MTDTYTRLDIAGGRIADIAFRPHPIDHDYHEQSAREALAAAYDETETPGDRAGIAMCHIDDLMSAIARCASDAEIRAIAERLCRLFD